MRRLISIVLICLLFASCAPQIDEREAFEWDYPEPEGPFVFYNIDEEGLIRYGLVSVHGEVILPLEHDHIGVLRSFDSSDFNRLPHSLPAGERFFSALRLERVYENGEYLLGFGTALISPEGNFLTGFDYTRIFHAPGNPTQIIGWRSDDHFVLLDYYGEESEIEDEFLLYSLSKAFPALWEEEWEWSLWGPDVPDQGFEWIMRTRSGNYWAAVTPQEDESWPGISLYSQYGILLTRHVYQTVYDIGGGLYVATARANGALWESYIISHSGRYLAGPYEHFMHHRGPRTTHLLGFLRNSAYVMTTEDFREQRMIEIPEGSYLYLAQNTIRPLAELRSQTMPLTVIALDSGEEVVFEDFIGYTVSAHDEALDRFVLHAMSSVLVDRYGGILAAAAQIVDSRMGYLVAITHDEGGEARFGLLDWDGNVLLEPDFRFMEPLAGNALQVVHGGTAGIIDLGGNWIYIHEGSPPAVAMTPSFLLAQP